MGLTLLDASEVQTYTLNLLGTPEATLLSPRALAALLRRTAGLYCPCPPSKLIRSVETALNGLHDHPDVKDLVKETLAGLLAYGDLQEHQAESEPGLPKRRLIFVTPPTFVVHTHSIYLVGVAPEQPAMLPESFEHEVKHLGFTRTIADPDGSLPQILQELGLRELPHDLWLWSPAPENAANFQQRFDRLLDQAEPVAAVPDLEILDPENPVTFYKGRWVDPKSRHTGRYVARRSQRYGARLWAYVELDAGRPLRLIDLPISQLNDPPGYAAWDQAWRLQAAIDHLEGHPQHLRSRTDEDKVLIDLFSPPPGWLERRWSVLGTRVTREKGALFTFSLPVDAAKEETRLAADCLWLKVS